MVMVKVLHTFTICLQPFLATGQSEMKTGSIILCVLLLLLVVSSCNSPKIELKLAPAAQLPANLQSAPVEVQEAYRFAIANKELLQEIPCFCGCNGIGHASNYACYVAQDGGPGQAVTEYDNHAMF